MSFQPLADISPTRIPSFEIDTAVGHRAARTVDPAMTSHTVIRTRAGAKLAPRSRWRGLRLLECIRRGDGTRLVVFNKLHPRIAGSLFTVCGITLLLSYVFLWLSPLALDPATAYVGQVDTAAVSLGGDQDGFIRYCTAFLVPMLLFGVALLIYPAVPRRLALYMTALITVAGPAILLDTKPVLSPDVHDYLMSARILTEYGANPYVVAAEQFPGDPYYEPVGWKNLPVVYGPLWVLLAAVPVLIAGNNAITGLLLMKALAIAAHVGTAALIYLTTKHIAPQRAGFAALVYGWNPFPVVFFALGGHNDAILVFFLMAAIYLAVRQQWMLAFPALTLAALVKYVPLLLFPIFLLAARRHPREALAGLAISGLLVAVAFGPFWAGSETFAALQEHGSRMVGSPVSALAHRYPEDALRLIGYVVFAVGYLVTLARTSSLIHRCFGVMFIYLATISFWTMPWYFTWPFALGALAGGPALLVMVLTSVGAFIFKGIFQWAWHIDYLGWQERWGGFVIESWMALSMLLPAIVVGAWLLLRWFANEIARYARSYDESLRRADTFQHQDN